VYFFEGSTNRKKARYGESERLLNDVINYNEGDDLEELLRRKGLNRYEAIITGIAKPRIRSQEEEVQTTPIKITFTIQKSEMPVTEKREHIYGSRRNENSDGE